MRFLKLIGVLMDYPQEELWLNREELIEACDDQTLDKSSRKKLKSFAENLLEQDPLTAQERWLGVFDRGRSMSLLLFEHIHGESRDRGQAMVDLLDAFKKAGFELDSRELPDYLPLVLEYLSLRTQEEAQDWLHHVSHILSLLAARASERKSPYQALFEVLVQFAEGKLEITSFLQRVAQEPRDDTPEAMDKVWEEEAVRFGPEAPGQDCDAPSRLPQGAVVKNAQVRS